MSKLLEKDLNIVLTAEVNINNIYNYYLKINKDFDKIFKFDVLSERDAFLKEFKKNYDFRKLYDYNIELFNIIHKFDLRLSDFVDSNNRAEIKKKYDIRVYNTLDKMHICELEIPRMFKIIFDFYKSYLNIKENSGRFFIRNLPEVHEVDILFYLFNKNGSLKSPESVYNELKKDMHIKSFDISKLNEPYKQIAELVLNDMKNKEQKAIETNNIYFRENVKVIEKVDIVKYPVDTSTDYFEHTYSRGTCFVCGEEMRMKLGGIIIRVRLPGEFENIDWFNYHEVAANFPYVDEIYYSLRDNNTNNLLEKVNLFEHVKDYISPNGDELSYINLEKPIKYSYNGETKEIDKIYYFEDSNIELSPEVESIKKVLVPSF